MRKPETMDRLITEMRHAIRVHERRLVALANALNELRYDHDVPIEEDG